MVITIARAFILLVSLAVAWLLFGKETRLRVQQRRWADLVIMSLLIATVALLAFLALRALLFHTGAVEYLDNAIG